MSILINEIPMPESCSKCFVKPACCPAIRKRLESKYQPYTWIPANYRHEDCPLVEVPPHGRLIDADAVFNNLERTGWYDNADRDIAEDLVLDAPTVIDAEGNAE